MPETFSPTRIVTRVEDPDARGCKGCSKGCTCLTRLKRRTTLARKLVRENMLSPYLGMSRWAVLFIGVLLPFQLFFSISAYATQAGASESVGGRPTSGAIVVYIRNSAGEPLTTPALVRLYSSDGMPIGQASVGSGGQAIFRNVHPGSYSIEVEAAGYENAQGRALLPMTGEADVDIYLQPENRTDSVLLSDPGTPVLAPKARKELDAGQEALSWHSLFSDGRFTESRGVSYQSYTDGTAASPFPGRSWNYSGERAQIRFCPISSGKGLGIG